MIKKKHLGKLISIHLKGRKTTIYGYLVDFSDKWALLKHNPGDYVMDGFIVFRIKDLTGIARGDEEKWRDKVIQMKGLQPSEEDKIPLADLSTIVKHLTDRFGMMEVYTKSETTCFLGKLNSMDKKELVLDVINTMGKWDGQMAFKAKAIRVLRFDNDYINSLKLVSNSVASDGDIPS